MDPKAMEPQGFALAAYVEGNIDAELVIHRDDGLEESMRVGHFFRDPAEFTEIEKVAIDLCSGRVLDVGAGAGIHSLALQQRGVRVTAIDISPQAVAVMVGRRVQDVRCQDVFCLQGGPFDTLLIMGHGIGMVENIAGLDDFLSHARDLTSVDGQVLLDSQDVRCTDDPRHLAYHEANRKMGRYIGEVRLRLAFQGFSGPPCSWLHVDPDTLGIRARAKGWTSRVILQEECGHYLAELTRLRTPE